jgi:transcriptional regulator with XRE-family HTH domain
MLIGERLRSFREGKNLSQGDIEKRTGLHRCYVSRAEHSHSVPALETLEKFARALEIPLYQLLYEGEEPPRDRSGAGRRRRRDEWGSFGKSARYLYRLREFLARMSERDRETLMGFAQKVTSRHVQVSK